MKSYFLLFCLLVVLIGCSKPDYSKPHEYIEVHGYGDGWKNTENNKRRFDHLLKAQIYAEIGSGKCEKYLSALDPENVFIEMAVINYLIRTEVESVRDIPIKYATLQCIAYHGADQNCEEKKLKFIKEADLNIREGTYLLLATMGNCDIKKEIGHVRTFSFDDSKKFKYIP